MKSLNLTPAAEAIAADSLRWMGPFGNDRLNLIAYPGREGHYGPLDASTTTFHPVRESAWWAVGLLMRDEPDDCARAAAILEAVLQFQFDAVGMPYHGTFHRAPEEPLPPGAAAKIWEEYDPNWREFIGTTFWVILEKLRDRIPAPLATKLEASIRLAMEGETPARIHAGYTNIAVMYAALLAEAGARFDRADWKAAGVKLAREIHAAFRVTQTFHEYNSPTYYGVVLYAVRLWRLFSKEPELVEWGAEMETVLWRQVGELYHAGLRNICGPFDRAYGMDMTTYIAGMGLFIGLGLEPGVAPPHPRLEGAVGHSHDLIMGPVVALVGAEIPADVGPHLQQFQGPRDVHQVIALAPEKRVATACLRATAMWGAESGALTAGWTQYHSATVHWRQPGGAIGWARLMNDLPLNATATATGFTVEIAGRETPSRIAWFVHSPPPTTPAEGVWEFPGLRIAIENSAGAPEVERRGEITVLSYDVPACQYMRQKLALTVI